MRREVGLSQAAEQLERALKLIASEAPGKKSKFDLQKCRHVLHHYLAQVRRAQGRYDAAIPHELILHSQGAGTSRDDQAKYLAVLNDLADDLLENGFGNDAVRLFRELERKVRDYIAQAAVAPPDPGDEIVYRDMHEGRHALDEFLILALLGQAQAFVGRGVGIPVNGDGLDPIEEAAAHLSGVDPAFEPRATAWIKFHQAMAAERGGDDVAALRCLDAALIEWEDPRCYLARAQIHMRRLLSAGPEHHHAIRRLLAECASRLDDIEVGNKRYRLKVAALLADADRLMATAPPVQADKGP